MRILVDITRQDKRSAIGPVVKRYTVDADATDRMLDVLLSIKSAQDATLSFRYSCAHGVCGSDAMRINGKERLACKTLVRDVAREGAEPPVITIEPLRHFPVERDLVVDQREFFRRTRTVAPYLLPASGAAAPDGGARDGVPAGLPSAGETLQTPQQQAQFEDATKCINCGACFSACPTLEKNPRFLGPAAIVQAARFVEDSRDWGLAPRLDALDAPDGIWGCENHFECTRVCPREIKVTKLINLMKRRVTQERQKRGELVHDQASAAGPRTGA